MRGDVLDELAVIVNFSSVVSNAFQKFRATAHFPAEAAIVVIGGHFHLLFFEIREQGILFSLVK
jgi:hypothetical protein